MIDSKAQTERREHKRYLAKFGSFYVYSPDWHVYGEVLDISRSGLSFCYVGEERLSDSSVTGKLFDNDSFRLDGILLKTVSDYKIASHSILMRRRGVLFCDASRTHIERIENFIRSFELREAGRN
jgi:nitrous oxidase accessory protein NosD